MAELKSDGLSSYTPSPSLTIRQIGHVDQNVVYIASVSASNTFQLLHVAFQLAVLARIILTMLRQCRRLTLMMGDFVRRLRVHWEFA